MMPCGTPCSPRVPPATGAGDHVDLTLDEREVASRGILLLLLLEQAGGSSRSMMTQTLVSPGVLFAGLLH